MGDLSYFQNLVERCKHGSGLCERSEISQGFGSEGDRSVMVNQHAVIEWIALLPIDKQARIIAAGIDQRDRA